MANTNVNAKKDVRADEKSASPFWNPKIKAWVSASTGRQMKKDFEFITVNEDSARDYCVILAKKGRKATYRYKNGKFIVTVWK